MGLFGKSRYELRSEIDILKYDIEQKDNTVLILKQDIDLYKKDILRLTSDLLASQSFLSTKTRQLEASEAKITKFIDECNNSLAKIGEQQNIIDAQKSVLERERIASKQRIEDLEYLQLQSAQWEQQVCDIIGYDPTQNEGVPHTIFERLEAIMEDTRWMDRLRMFISNSHSPAITLDTQPDMVDLKPKKNKKYTRRLAIDTKRKPKK